jgi:hypothetical protein
VKQAKVRLTDPNGYSTTLIRDGTYTGPIRGAEAAAEAEVEGVDVTDVEDLRSVGVGAEAGAATAVEEVEAAETDAVDEVVDEAVIEEEEEAEGADAEADADADADAEAEAEAEAEAGA